MKILEKGLKNIAQNSQKFSEGIDYLRVKISPDMSPGILNYFDEIIGSIDNDNSNVFIDNSFSFPITWNKIYLTTGPALIGSIVYNNLSIPCFCYNEFHENNKKMFNSYGKFDFYGQFFRLKEINYIDDHFYNFFFKIFNDSLITRIDYRYDFFNYPGDLFLPEEIISQAKNTPGRDHHTGNIVHSWLRGTKDSYRWLVRAYDKMKDVNSKGKFAMYGDYIKFDSAYRLEFEYLNKWCYGFNLSDLDKLVVKCKNHINFQPLGCEPYKSYNKLDLSNELDKIKYVRTTKGYLNTLIDNNINLFDIAQDLYLDAGLSSQEVAKLQKNLISYYSK